MAELPEYSQDLPYPPHLLRDLFTMTGADSVASAEEISRSISQDQSLTARILTLANSAFYGLQAQVTSVARAVVLLGLKEVRNIVLAIGVQHLAAQKSPAAGFDLREYWNHQLAVAVCCKSLAKKEPRADPDVLFTAGLLHDMGKLFTAMHRPDDWLAVTAKAEEQSISVAAAEEDHWGLEHGVIAGMVLNSWNLPPELSEPVNWHHAPGLCVDYPAEARIVCLADGMHHWLADPDYPVPESFQRVLAKSLDAYGASQEELAEELQAELGGEDLMQLAAVLA